MIFALSSIRDWLVQQKIPTLAPPTLESALYGDASHPLTEGYRQLAVEIRDDAVYQKWLAGSAP